MTGTRKARPPERCHKFESAPDFDPSEELDPTRPVGSDFWNPKTNAAGAGPGSGEIPNLVPGQVSPTSNQNERTQD